MNRAIEPPINTITEISLPSVDVRTLDNGVPVYMINAGGQEVVKLELLFKAGKWYEEKNLVADLTNRMLREGAAGKTAKQIADVFDYYGTNVNYGAAFETAGVVMYSLSRNAGKVLPLLAEIFTEADFPEKELGIVVNNRKQRLAVEMEKNDFLANRAFVSALFGKTHPYGRVTEPGDFDAFNTKDLRDFYKRYYNAANLVLIVSGKFDESVFSDLNKYFGSKSWLGLKAPDTINYPIQSASELVLHTEKADSVQSAVICGNLSINKYHPDFQKLSVLNTVFGGYFGSRLMSNIREEKGYTYGIYSSFVSYPHHGFMEIAAEVGKDVRQSTLNEIEKEINTIRTELIAEEELEIVKNYMCGKILRSVDGPLKYSETLKGLIIYNQDASYIRELLQTIRSVTAAELLELAKVYFDFDKMYKVTVG
ncbi:MAG: pitrilysin family protein [Chitinophagales bacterium]